MSDIISRRRCGYQSHPTVEGLAPGCQVGSLIGSRCRPVKTAAYKRVMGEAAASLSFLLSLWLSFINDKEVLHEYRGRYM